MGHYKRVCTKDPIAEPDFGNNDTLGENFPDQNASSGWDANAEHKTPSSNEYSAANAGFFPF
jgi:hypothetical protein